MLLMWEKQGQEILCLSALNTLVKQTHTAGSTMILCCMRSLDPWFACVLFCSVLWLSRSFVWLFCFSCPSLFYLFVPCLWLDALPVCVCCHFLSSAGVWTTESKGDHSGSARQLDSGSRCGVLLISFPPEPSFALSLCFKENSCSWMTLCNLFKLIQYFLNFPRVRSALSGEKKLQVKSWNSGVVF